LLAIFLFDKNHPLDHKALSFIGNGARSPKKPIKNTTPQKLVLNISGTKKCKRK